MLYKSLTINKNEKKNKIFHHAPYETLQNNFSSIHITTPYRDVFSSFIGLIKRTKKNFNQPI